jgi:hypothetical protein
MGPVLAFHGCNSNAWEMSALVVSSSATPPGALTLDDKRVIEAQSLWTVGKKTAWRYRFSIILKSK